jgi:hypothetical protein
MKTRSVLAALAIVTAVGVSASPAQAKDVDVRGTAACTAGVKAKIKAGPRDPRQIKTNIQIDDRGAVPQVWTIVVTDGAETQTLTTTTAGASNSLDQDVFTSNGAGADTVTFTATRAGASCSGTVTV